MGKEGEEDDEEEEKTLKSKRQTGGKNFGSSFIRGRCLGKGSGAELRKILGSLP
jgi:hypothetical protein